MCEPFGHAKLMTVNFLMDWAGFVFLSVYCIQAGARAVQEDVDYGAATPV